MLWHVHYTNWGMSGLLTASSLPIAFKRACDLLDLGAEVSQIESTGILPGMNAAEIRHARTKRVERMAKKNDVH